MCKILLSIHPQHVANILNGSKKYEYRKTRCKEEVGEIVIYETSPTMKVVGEVEVIEIIEDSPMNVWEKTSSRSGINKKFFDRYYQNRPRAVAYKLGKVMRYDRALELEELGVHYPPQSFIYLKT